MWKFCYSSGNITKNAGSASTVYGIAELAGETEVLVLVGLSLTRGRRGLILAGSSSRGNGTKHRLSAARACAGTPVGSSQLQPSFSRGGYHHTDSPGMQSLAQGGKGIVRCRGRADGEIFKFIWLLIEAPFVGFNIGSNW